MGKELVSHEDYVREIAKILAKLPVERAAEVYDFARFLLAPRPVEFPISEDDDWLNDSQEQIGKEDAEWEQVLMRDQEKTRALAAEARAEYESGKTTLMFDEKGDLNLP